MDELSDAAAAAAQEAQNGAVVAVLAELVAESNSAFIALAESAVARGEHELANQALDASGALVLKAERLVALVTDDEGGAGDATSPGGNGESG